MLPDKRKYSIQEIFDIFEIDRKHIEMVNRPHRDMQAAQKACDELKEMFHKQYRKLSLKYHPDQGGDENDFKTLNRLYDFMKKQMIVRPLRPQPVVQYSYIRVYTSVSVGTTSSTSTTTGGWW